MTSSAFRSRPVCFDRSSKLSPLNSVALSLALLFRAALALARSTNDTKTDRFDTMLHVHWDPTLRAELAAYTHLPAGAFKLVYKGAVMKDDGAPLSTYKLAAGSTIALIGGTVAAGKPPAPASTPVQAIRAGKTPLKTEESTIAAIRAELAGVRTTLVPDVDTFVAGAPGGGGGAGRTPTEHARLSELLLQALLRLDAMGVGAEWPEARGERKAAVREVQGVLDRLDGAWTTR